MNQNSQPDVENLSQMFPLNGSMPSSEAIQRQHQMAQRPQRNTTKSQESSSSQITSTPQSTDGPSRYIPKKVGILLIGR